MFRIQKEFADRIRRTRDKAISIIAEKSNGLLSVEVDGHVNTWEGKPNFSSWSMSVYVFNRDKKRLYVTGNFGINLSNNGRPIPGQDFRPRVTIECIAVSFKSGQLSQFYSNDQICNFLSDIEFFEEIELTKEEIDLYFSELD